MKMTCLMGVLVEGAEEGGEAEAETTRDRASTTKTRKSAKGFTRLLQMEI
jgi:hypothetical protein